VKQVFQRIDPPSLEALDDVRFQYFSEHVLPRMRASAQSHTLIFVSSYFEYVRVRNLFQKLADESELTFCKLSEYDSSRS
jgi:U3 small nucleolar RNA-associated protein 25